MDSHVCVLRVLGGMCGLPFTCMWCLEGCVDSHGCTMDVLSGCLEGCVLRVLGGMCRQPLMCSQDITGVVSIATDVLSER